MSNFQIAENSAKDSVRSTNLLSRMVSVPPYQTRLQILTKFKTRHGIPCAHVRQSDLAFATGYSGKSNPPSSTNGSCRTSRRAVAYQGPFLSQHAPPESQAGWQRRILRLWPRLHPNLYFAEGLLLHEDVQIFMRNLMRKLFYTLHKLTPLFSLSIY
jgi:hypothetical protein